MKTLCSRCEVDITKRREVWERAADAAGYARGLEAGIELGGLARENREPAPSTSPLFARFQVLPTMEEWKNMLVEEAVRRYGTGNRAAPIIGIGKTTARKERRMPNPNRDVDDELDFTRKETAPIESTGHWPADQVSPLGFPIPELPKPTGRDIAQRRWSER